MIDYLAPVIANYRRGGPLGLTEAVALRAHFRRWMLANAAASVEHDKLRGALEVLIDRNGITLWLGDAAQLGLHPLGLASVGAVGAASVVQNGAPDDG